MHRRELLKGAVAGALTLWGSSRGILKGQTTSGVSRLTDNLAVVNGGGGNLVAFSTAEGLVLVDAGAPNFGSQVMSSLNELAPGKKVSILFNTHYHVDQTGNNELFAAAGAKIIAHERTRQWMSTDYWIPEEDRYERARPKAARPTEAFLTTGSLKIGTEQIDYGHLMLAHTSGDIYVLFKTGNVIAVGDVASPLRDPALDYFAGGWIGGRVDAMDALLKLSNAQTRFVPAWGPVITRAEFQAERDMMEEVRARVWEGVRKGEGPKDMLEAGALNGLARTWKEPYKFLYDAAKGLWGHHNALDHNLL